MSPAAEIALLAAGTAGLAFIFAKLEINIEGEDGWAANLPTWRIENHWALDVFLGGRALTGYHFWALAFVAAVLHFPFVLAAEWNWRWECRVLAAMCWFWILEDFLWFVLNPAFGVRRFRRRHIPWHKKWILGVPMEYVVYSLAGAGLVWLSYGGWAGPRG